MNLFLYAIGFEIFLLFSQLALSRESSEGQCKTGSEFSVGLKFHNLGIFINEKEDVL
jgi:hypothetical protein